MNKDVIQWDPNSTTYLRFDNFYLENSNPNSNQIIPWNHYYNPNYNSMLFYDQGTLPCFPNVYDSKIYINPNQVYVNPYSTHSMGPDHCCDNQSKTFDLAPAHSNISNNQSCQSNEKTTRHSQADLPNSIERTANENYSKEEGSDNITQLLLRVKSYGKHWPSEDKLLLWYLAQQPGNKKESFRGRRAAIRDFVSNLTQKYNEANPNVPRTQKQIESQWSTLEWKMQEQPGFINEIAQTIIDSQLISDITKIAQEVLNKAPLNERAFPIKTIRKKTRSYRWEEGANKLLVGIVNTHFAGEWKHNNCDKLAKQFNEHKIRGKLGVVSIRTAAQIYSHLLDLTKKQKLTKDEKGRLLLENNFFTLDETEGKILKPK